MILIGTYVKTTKYQIRPMGYVYHSPVDDFSSMTAIQPRAPDRRFKKKYLKSQIGWILKGKLRWQAKQDFSSFFQ